MQAIVYTDASYDNETRAAGWAAWISLSDDRIFSHHGTFRGKILDSVQAETEALYIGLWYARHHGAIDIMAHLDCQAVISAFHGKGKHGASIRTTLGASFSDCVIGLKHVKAHTRDWTSSRVAAINRWCDIQAKREMQAQRQIKKDTDNGCIHQPWW